MKWKLYFVIVLLAVLTPYAYLLRFKTVAPRGAPVLDRIPLSLDGFSGSDGHLGAGTLRVIGADETMFRLYEGSDHRKIWLFLGYFDAAQENSQIHSPKHCYPGSGWNIYGEGTQEVEIAGRRVAVKRLYISDGTRRRVVFYWFATRSGLVTNEFALKWNQMKNSLLRKAQSTAFVRFSAEVDEGEGEVDAQGRLASFVEMILPYIESALEGPLGG